MTCMRVCLLGAVAMAMVGGCSTVKVHVETIEAPPSPAARPRTVLLAPLLNRSDDKLAGIAMRAQLARALASRAGMRVVDVPAGIPVDPAGLDREQARELARTVGADGIVTGILFAYGYLPGAGVPPCATVRLDVRLFGRDSPDLVWAARASGIDSPGAASGGTTLTTLGTIVAEQVATNLAGGR